MYHLIFSPILNLSVICWFGKDNSNQAVMYDCGIYRTSSDGYLITFRAKLQNWTPSFASNCGNGWLFLTTFDFREPAVYLVTSIRGTPVSCLLIIKYRSMWPSNIDQCGHTWIYLIKLLYLSIQVRLYVCNWYFSTKVWKLTRFRTCDGGSPTKDRSPIKNTTTTPMIKTKKSVMNCAFWLELTQNYRNFWTCVWIFCWNIQCLTIYIGDRYFFRYRHVRFDTNINPQVHVAVFDINREPVPAPREYGRRNYFMTKSL